MSTAKPMEADYRSMHYILVYDAEDNYGVRPMSGPQRRRWVHKLHRTGERWPDYTNTKRQRTRRRSAAIALSRERRRDAETRRAAARAAV
jgi:hypothetical protein